MTTRSRREFLHSSIAIAATPLMGPKRSRQVQLNQPSRAPRIRFAVIGVNHSHINSQVQTVVRGGGQLVSFYAKESDLAVADLGELVVV